MAVAEILGRLGSMGDEKTKALNARHGALENQFGLKMGQIRAVAKEFKPSHEVAMGLWETGNYEAMLLATLAVKPKSLSTEALEKMVREAKAPNLADWLNSYVVKQHPASESVRERWMDDPDCWVARSGWSLTSDKVQKGGEGLDIVGLLDRIERELGSAPPEVQWTMNFALGYIAINNPQVRERAVGIGERIGLYSDYPTSKGCIPPYVPVWVREIVGRQS